MMLDGTTYIHGIDRHRWVMRRALKIAGHSPDPATKVGSVILDSCGQWIMSGFNHLPIGIEPTICRLHDRETKLRLIVHAEMDAILNAARCGRPTNRGTLYIAATDDTGLVWGGPPCVRCTVEVIQAGIQHIVTYPQKTGFSKWHADLAVARNLLAEAGVTLLEIPHE